MTAGQQADVWCDVAIQPLFDFRRRGQPCRFAHRRFEQVFDVAARAAVAQRHVAAQPLGPHRGLVQPWVAGVGVAGQPGFAGIGQLAAGVGV